MSFLDKLGGNAKNIGDKTGEMLTVRYALVRRVRCPGREILSGMRGAALPAERINRQ